MSFAALQMLMSLLHPQISEPYFTPGEALSVVMTAKAEDSPCREDLPQMTSNGSFWCSPSSAVGLRNCLDGLVPSHESKLEAPCPCAAPWEDMG